MTPLSLTFVFWGVTASRGNFLTNKLTWSWLPWICPLLILSLSPLHCILLSAVCLGYIRAFDSIIRNIPKLFWSIPTCIHYCLRTVQGQHCAVCCCEDTSGFFEIADCLLWLRLDRRYSERSVEKRVCRRGRVMARIPIRREMFQLHDLAMKSLSKGLTLKTAFEDQ